MSETLTQVRRLIDMGRVEVSLHAVQSLADDGILIEPMIRALGQCIVVEDYPHYHKGPCVLVLQRDEIGRPVHLLWGIPAGKGEPAVLITAYRPDPDRWTADYAGRRT